MHIYQLESSLVNLYRGDYSCADRCAFHGRGGTQCALIEGELQSIAVERKKMRGESCCKGDGQADKTKRTRRGKKEPLLVGGVVNSPSDLEHTASMVNIRYVQRFRG